VATFGFCGPFSSLLEYFYCWASNTKFKKSNFLIENADDSSTLRALKGVV
jgi:hypothetical protein